MNRHLTPLILLLLAAFGAEGWSADRIVSVVAGGGPFTNGFGTITPATAAYMWPQGVINGPPGLSVYITDFQDNRIRVVDTTSGTISTIAGTGVAGSTGDGGLATQATVGYPTQVAVDHYDNVYIADTTSGRIRKITAATGIISTLINGAGSSLCLDRTGNVYFASGCQIKKFDAASGVITVIAGTGANGYSGDGGQATAAVFGSHLNVFVTVNNTVYISDSGFHVVRVITPWDGVVSTVAGNGAPGFSGDGGLAINAQLASPEGVQVDSNGNCFISDRKNARIRRIDVHSGIITTIAGTGAFGPIQSGVPATATPLTGSVYGMSIDNAGNLFFADSIQGGRVYKIATDLPQFTQFVWPSQVTTAKSLPQSVLATDNGGEASLTYTWVGAGITFSDNADNSAKNVTMTFSQAGVYPWSCTVTDADGSTAFTYGTVTVNQVYTSVDVEPQNYAVPAGGGQQFTATARDQFGAPMQNQPDFTNSWTASGGVITSTGFYTATTVIGSPFTITAGSQGISGSSSIPVSDFQPSFTVAPPDRITTGATTTSFSVLGFYVTGAESQLTYTWSTYGPQSGAVEFSANGTNSAKNTTVTFHLPGYYYVTCTVTSPYGASLTSWPTTIQVSTTISRIAMTPPTLTLLHDGFQTFTATVSDQFGNTVTYDANTPVALMPTWTVANVHAQVRGISNQGFYQYAPNQPAPITDTVTAAVAGVSGSAAVTIANNPPTLAAPIFVNQTGNPQNGINWFVSAVGNDDDGGLVGYAWSVLGSPPNPPTLSSANQSGTNLVFKQAGTYTVQVVLSDSNGATTTATAPIVIAPIATTVTVNPVNPRILLNATQTFTAVVKDQFGMVMNVQPFWGAFDGGATITQAGVYTPGSAGGPFTVFVSSGGASTTTTINVDKLPQTLTFSALPAKTFGNPPFTLSAPSTSGLSATFTSSDPTIASISGSTLTILGGGTVTITASQAGNATYAAAPSLNQTLTVGKATQVITFNPLVGVTFGGAAFQLTGTSTSNLTVTYASSVPGVATVSGSTVTIVGAGSTTITATQAGNASYTPAGSVQQPLTVAKAAQSITSFGALPSKTVGDQAFTLTAAATSGLTPTYTSSNTAVATVSGALVTIVGAGTTNIIAAQSGNANYNAAPSLTQPLVVKQNQTITFSALPPKTYGNAPFTVAASASSGLTVAFASSNSAVASVSGTTVTVVGAGTATITATQAGNGAFNAAPPIQQVLTVAKAAQVITFGAIPGKTYGNAPFSPGASADSGLTITYSSATPAVASVSGANLVIVGAGTSVITASQAGDANHLAAQSLTQTLTVAKAAQVITFNALPTKTYGDAAFSPGASADSGLTITYSSATPAVATVSGTNLVIAGVGTSVIMAAQAGDANHLAAQSKTQMLTVAKAAQVITFSAIPGKTYGNAAFSPGATANSGLTITYSSATPAVATVSGLNLVIAGAGSSVITASQAGDANHLAAPSLTQTLTVAKAAQTISFSALPAKNVGDAAFVLGATTSSGLTPTYTSSTPAVATVSGATVTIVAAGTTTITAAQAGNANYNAAASVSQPLAVKQGQVITFGTLPTKTVGDATFLLGASASSGLTVGYASSNGAVATVSGATVTIIAAGTTTITASQAGNATFNPAPPVNQVLTVVKKAQAITFATLPGKVLGQAPFTLGATASSGLTPTYTSSNTAVATVSGAQVTLTGVGTTTITASQSGNATFAAAAPVNQPLTVTNTAPTVATAAAVTPSPVTTAGAALSALGGDDAGEANLTYTWSVTATPSGVLASAVHLGANGSNAAKATTATFPALGAYTFQAAIRDAGGLSVTSSVTAVVSQGVATLVVAPASVRLNPGASQAFTVTAFDQFGAAMATPAGLTWGKSGGGTISATGVFTAGASPGGPFTVTASFGAINGPASVIVNAAPTVATAASAAPATVGGTTTALSVLGADDAGEAGLTYTWAATTAPAAVAFSVNASNAAKATTATFTAAGSYVLQATIRDGGGLQVTSSVSVTVSATVTTVVVSPSAPAVVIGKSQQFTAVARDQFGTALASQPTPTWAVTGGGTISSTGLFTAGSSVGGPFTVTAAAGRNGTTTLMVVNTAPTIATAAAASPSAVAGTTTALSVLGADDGGEPALLYGWTATGSSPTGVVFSVNHANQAKNTVATFSQAGTYTFQCLVQDAGGLSVTSGTVTVTVAQTVTAVTVSPAVVSVGTGLTQQFSAVANDQFGKQAPVTWTVAPTTGPIISASGLLTAGATTGGPFTVTATTSGGQHGAATVTVVARPVATTIVITPSSVTMDRYGTYPFTAVVKDQLGNPLQIQPAIAWSADHGAISAGGVFSPQGYQSTSTITATASGISAQATAVSNGFNAPPVITQQPVASATTVTGTTVVLNVGAVDASGAAALTYTWASVGAPPSPVTFSPNGSGAAASTVVSFTAPGTYTFLVNIDNPLTAGTISNPVTVTVVATTTSIALSPGGIQIPPNSTKQFAVNAFDQFGKSLTPGVIYAWSANGGGGINPISGLYTAGATSSATLYTITAVGGGLSASTQVMVNATNAAPVKGALSASPNPTTTNVVTLSAAPATDDLGESNVVYTWYYLPANSPPNTHIYTELTNGTHAGRTQRIAVTVPGTYLFWLQAQDQNGAYDGTVTLANTISVTFNFTQDSVHQLVVSPDLFTPNPTFSNTFTAQLIDTVDFQPENPQPTFTWSVAPGGGLIDPSTGTFTAGATPGGPYTVTCTGGGFTGHAQVRVNASPTFAIAPSPSDNPSPDNDPQFSALGADDGGEINLLYTWSVLSGPGSASFTMNGTHGAKNTTALFTRKGAYVVQAQLTDAGGKTATATTAVTIADAAPSALDETVTTAKNTPVTITFQGTDPDVGDALTFTPTSSPAHGTLSGSGASRTYTPFANFAGEDTFTYKANDGTADSPLATVVVVVAVDPRVSAMVVPVAFDSARWAADAAYRAAYLATVEPGRVWQSADGASGVPTLVAVGSRRKVMAANGTVQVAVKGQPNAPVTFFCTGEGSFTATGRNALTVQADSGGTATATFQAPAAGRIPLLVASPLAVGQVRFVAVLP